jgi:8-amino-7-oxononanoate synthase
MPDPLDFIDDELRDLEGRGLRRRLRVVQGPQGPRVTVEGRALRLFCSNDYLGLANHPALIAAAQEAVERYGYGTGASRLVCGTMEAHAALEGRLAGFLGTEGALVFPSGYAANVGVIPALVGQGDAVLLDRLSHASIVDGARLSGAKLLVYPHRDVERLREVLGRHAGFRRRLIVTDGVFSVDGDIAPLREIQALARQHGAILMVDDAHGTGVLGATGRGTLEHFSLDPVDILMGSLSKALGASGGFIAGGRRLIDYLINRSRGFIFTTALPPDACAVSTAALDLVASQPGLRERLWQNVARVRGGLLEMGLDLMGSETQILPVRIGDAKRAVEVSDFLYERGIFLSAIRPPTVPEGESRLRLTVTAAHDEEDIGCLLEAMNKAKRFFF